MTRHTTPSGTPLFRTSGPSVSIRPQAGTKPISVQQAPVGDVHLSGSVRFVPESNRFEIRFSYKPEATGFMHSLPESKWHGKEGQKFWRCLATPLAAWKLRNAGLVIDGYCAEMAEQWERAIEKPVRGSVDVSFLKTQPKPHQIAAMEFSANKIGSMQALSMGCGKTLTAIGLMCHWRCRTVLVLCPKAVLGVWRREMDKHCALSQNIVVLEESGGAAKRDSAIRALRSVDNYAVTMIVVNYESAWREPLVDVLMKHKWDLLVLDESHRASDAQSCQSKASFQFAMNSGRRLLLTGTPMDNPLNLFAQYKVIEPALFGTSFSRFRSRYAITHERYKGKVLELVNQDELIALYKQLAFRVETLDVWDLPKLDSLTIPVTLEKETMKAYRTLAKQCLLEIEQGIVNGDNAGTRLIRLAQMACGHLKTEDGNTHRIGGEKKDALIDFLRDIPLNEPVVVFARFREDLAQIAEVAHATGRRYGEISGARKDLTPHSTMPEGIDLMGVQERAGGVGIDLTRARYCVYFSHGYSLKDFEQSAARVHRPGQERPTFIYHLTACGTVDEAIMQALESKTDIVEAVLKHIKWDGKQ